MEAADIIPPGWSVSEKYRSVLAKLPNQNEVLNHLLNTDMRDYGVAWLESKKGKDALDAEGQVLQVVRVRNIAIPQAEEDFQVLSTGSSSLNRLLKITLTDGKSNIVALDVDNSPKLSCDTAPGTKVRLTNRVQIRVGFLIFKRHTFEVLRGSVESMRREWLLTRDVKGTCRAHRNGDDAPPPFAAFGTPEAASMIEAHRRFVNTLHSRACKTEGAFDSLKTAMNATTKASAAPAEGDSEFQQKRQEILSEAKGDPSSLVQHKFKAGGSKFQQARVDQAVERDRNLAQLVAMGYGAHEASAALEDSKNSLEGAVDRLTARQFGRGLGLRRGTGGGGRGSNRGGGAVGRGRGRGSKSGDIEDDPRFDPVAAMEESGLRGRPSSGPVPLAAFLDAPLPSQSRCGQTAAPVPVLPLGTVVQARVMSGDYEAARLVGRLPEKAPGGEHVAVVLYLDSGLQEEVPVSMLRTLDNTEVTSNMLPVVPNSALGTNTESFRGRFTGGGGRGRGGSRGFSGGDRGRGPGGRRGGGGDRGGFSRGRRPRR